MSPTYNVPAAQEQKLPATLAFLAFTISMPAKLTLVQLHRHASSKNLRWLLFQFSLLGMNTTRHAVEAKV